MQVFCRSSASRSLVSVLLPLTPSHSVSSCFTAHVADLITVAAQGEGEHEDKDAGAQKGERDSDQKCGLAHTLIQGFDVTHAQNQDA